MKFRSDIPARHRNLGKRGRDVALALVAIAVLMPVLIGLALLVLGLQGRPVFYVSRRVGRGGRRFWLWKFRSMRPVAADCGLSGGHKQDRISTFGAWLRRTHLDETPQLWNILRGDMSFIGPRPALPEHVARFPDRYAPTLGVRPGLTGLASLRVHKYEARLLGACTTPRQSDQVYFRRCLPKKIRLDLYYQRHQSLAFDLWILWQTLRLLLAWAPAMDDRPPVLVRRAAQGPLRKATS
jgi:lipopolysaccharide/colanic/teichoic acid biosynthesis glycosyltransferase